MSNVGITMLSILIPSIPSRVDRLRILQNELDSQVKTIYTIDNYSSLGDIEILIDDSKTFLDGGLSIGKKRESLVQRANGKYVVFLDDDDSISPNYIEALLRLCNTDVDVCTFRAIVKLQNSWGLVDMSLKYQFNEQFTPEYTIRRKPWHICPIRSEFAKLYEFKDINNAEDFEWTERVLTHCTTEAHTDKILFQYSHGSHSEADKITANGQI